MGDRRDLRHRTDLGRREAGWRLREEPRARQRCSYPMHILPERALRHPWREGSAGHEVARQVRPCVPETPESSPSSPMRGTLRRLTGPSLARSGPRGGGGDGSFGRERRQQPRHRKGSGHDRGPVRDERGPRGATITCVIPGVAVRVHTRKGDDLGVWHVPPPVEVGDAI